jgi:hypothetical protein
VPEARRSGEKLILGFAGPVLEAAGVTLVLALDLLKQDQVGFELMDPGTQLVDVRHATKAEEVSNDPLVDVVGRDPQAHPEILQR